MPALRALVFDFDGVLVESVDVKTRAFARLFEHEGPAVVERVVSYHLAHGGISRFEKFRYIHREILGRPLPDAEFQRLCEDFAALVRDAVIASPWVNGAEALIREQRGELPLFIVSGTPEEELRDILSRRGVLDAFAAVYGAPTEKPQHLARILRDYRWAPADVLFVGDAQTDWDAARATGVGFVWRRAAPQSPRPRGFEGPVVDDMKDLSRLLQRACA